MTPAQTLKRIDVCIACACVRELTNAYRTIIRDKLTPITTPITICHSQSTSKSKLIQPHQRFPPLPSTRTTPLSPTSNPKGNPPPPLPRPTNHTTTIRTTTTTRRDQRRRQRFAAQSCKQCYSHYMTFKRNRLMTFCDAVNNHAPRRPRSPVRLPVVRSPRSSCHAPRLRVRGRLMTVVASRDLRDTLSLK